MNYFKFLFTRKFFFVPAHLFMWFFIYISVGIYLFKVMDIYLILWVIIQCYLIYAVAQIVPTLTIANSFSWFLCLFGVPRCMRVYVCKRDHLLILWHYKTLQGSSCLFSDSVLTSAISLRSPEFFYWRIVLEIKSWVPNVLLNDSCDILG